MDSSSGASKRRAREEADGDARAAATAAAAASAAASAVDGGLPEDLEFEDPYEDIIEEEEVDEDDDEDDGDMDEEDEGEDGEGGGAGAGAGSSSSAAAAAAAAGAKAKKGAAKKRAGAGAMDEDDDDDAAAGGHDVFRPGLDALGDGEALDFDPSAYVMYHALAPEWPCLSFDVMPDRLGAGRTRFPLSLTAVAGTQADSAGANQLLVMRLSSLNKTGGRDGDSDSDDESDDDDSEYDDDPVLEVQRIGHPSGTVNRVRVMPQGPHVVATWSEAGKVHLWDVRPQLALLDAAAGKGAAPPVPSGYGPAMTWGGHKSEGYAVDWSPVAAGRLATGDCSGRIHVWEADAAAAASAASSSAASSSAAGSTAGVWSVDGGKPYVGHTGSVEDLQWSPNEGTVFASCSADKTVRIWDTRVAARSMLSVPGADCDVNVLSWSRLVSYLLASGNDDGSFRIWDLRAFKPDAAIAHFAWHKQQVTGIEWAPDDENVLAVCAADGTTTLWDMSLEEDEEAELALTEGGANKKGGANKPKVTPSTQDARLKDIPPQLLFLHAGQRVTKEVHWHKQLPGVVLTTAFDGFNVWKPDVYTTH